MSILGAAGVLPMGADFLAAADAGAAGPTPAGVVQNSQIALNLGPEDRCPVCGMRPIKHPKFACRIDCLDGTAFIFCSAGCLLRAWLRPETFLSVPSGGLKRAVVQEYFSGRPTDAATVTWVAGSDVIGPMGPAVVALAGEEHLAAFKRRHGGRQTFRMNELTDTLWQKITGRPSDR